MSRFAASFVLGALFVSLVGCGDDTTSSGSGGGGGAVSSSGSTVSSASSSSKASAGSTSSSGGGGSGDTTAATSSGSAGGDGSGGTGGTGGAGSGGGGTGGGTSAACNDLPAGPFVPSVFSSALGGSEDIALDGLGHLAGKKGDQMVLLDGDGAETVLAEDVPSAFGTRFAPDGSLIVALPNAGQVISIDAEGHIDTLASGLSGPNGIHVTTDGVVWVTELPAGRIQTIAAGEDAEPFLAAGEAPAANGIFVDEDRAIVFFTNYSAGEVWRVDLTASFDPVRVTSIGGAALDGLTMDICGNLYAVDQANADIYRVRTDASGDLVGEPELIASLPSGIANAQFGRGPGFSPTTLYAAGTPGDIYAIDVGVRGAPQAGP